MEDLPRDVALLCIGRELLKGNTLDRNAHWMSGRVESLGLRCWRFSTVDDVPGEIEAETGWLLGSKTRFLVTSGGLGPTFDDMTLRCLAGALGLAYLLDPVAEAMVRQAYEELFRRGLSTTPELTPGRLKMAFLPQGALALANPCGAAPGMRLEHGATTLFSLPGVPEEMQAMFKLHVEPALARAGRPRVRRQTEIAWEGKDESLLENHTAAVTKAWPGLYVKSRVRGVEDQVRIRITLWCEGEEGGAVEATLAGGEADLRARLGLSASSGR